jgi:uncharacterized membrane protein
MPSLVTRFHLLLFTITVAITGVALVHIPSSFAFAAHWRGSAADWTWPRDVALATALLLQIAFLGGFHLLGRVLTKNHIAKTRHILEPALTLLMALPAACQLALLFNGIGSDLDLFRGTAFALAAVLLVFGVVIFEAERHSYAGLRMPWPIASDRAWRVVHRLSGAASGLCALGLAALAWSDPGPGLLTLSMAASLIGLLTLAACATLVTRRL